MYRTHILSLFNLQSRPKQLDRFADFRTFSLPIHPHPRYNVDLQIIFATFGVNLEHASLDQSFLPANQHCFGREGREGRKARTGRFARVTNNAMELKISLFVSVPTNFGQDCSFAFRFLLKLLKNAQQKLR